MPSDADMTEHRYHYYFIHNVFGHFFKDVLDYFSDYLYPRFQWTVVGTYEKAVEYIDKQTKLGREADMPKVPALILNPTGEFTTADAAAGGRQLWRFPNLAPGLANLIFEPIYTDANVEVNVCFSRFKGEIELIMLLPSFYEYCDLRVLLIQIFGGLERWIYPVWFNSFIIFEEDAWNYTYENDLTGERYQIDWENHGASERLIKSTARNERVFPCRIKPTFRLMSLTDGSTRYGGTDRLPDWRLNATVEYEVEFPSYMTFRSDALRPSGSPPPIMNLKYGSSYSSYEQFAQDIGDKKHIISQGSDEYEITNRYFHQITSTEADSTADIQIELPITIDTTSELDSFVVVTKYGLMAYGEHYQLINNGNTLVIFSSDPEDVLIDRLYTTIREKQPDGTYVKKSVATQRYKKDLDGSFVSTPSGPYVKDMQQSYSITKDGRFYKDPLGPYVYRGNDVYEEREEDDYDLVVKGHYVPFELEEGDFIEFYIMKQIA